MPRERLMEIARRVYRSYGFAPIDTPALEYLEILTGKGSDETDKQLYRFIDHGKREVGMRFDLTVPLARFVAQHAGTLGLPFKRYHIAPVWRGENTQRGRYREFMQCDFDTIGTKSVAADIEMVLVIGDLLQALGFQKFTIHLNDRRILTGLLESLGLSEQTTAVLRALDKLAKIGKEKVIAEMERTAGATAAQANDILELVATEGTNADILQSVQAMAEKTEAGSAGLQSLRTLLDAVSKAGLDARYVKIDLSIARGLDYYTGTVLETTLDDLPGIGSVASGGRYDNLADLYTKQELPGVGASLGLDRLLAAMEELKLLGQASTPAEIFVPFFDKEQLGRYLKLAAQLRSAGFRVEVFPDAKKLGKQLQYANRKGHRIALVLGADEFEAGTCQVKDLKQGTSETLEYKADEPSILTEYLKKAIG